MEFNLKQLNPENLKLIFESAYYSVAHACDHEFDGNGRIKSYGHISIPSNPSVYVVVPMPCRNILRFACVTKFKIREGETEEGQLRVANTLHDKAIHYRFNGKEKCSNHDVWSWTFLCSRLVPEEIPLSARDLIMTFRLFQKESEESVRSWHRIVGAAKL